MIGDAIVKRSPRRRDGCRLLVVGDSSDCTYRPRIYSIVFVKKIAESFVWERKRISMILDDYIVFYLREKSNRKTFPQIYNPLQFILLIIVNVFFRKHKKWTINSSRNLAWREKSFATRKIWFLSNLTWVTRFPTSGRGGDTRSHEVDECAKIGRGWLGRLLASIPSGGPGAPAYGTDWWILTSQRSASARLSRRDRFVRDLIRTWESRKNSDRSIVSPLSLKH